MAQTYKKYRIVTNGKTFAVEEMEDATEELEKLARDYILMKTYIPPKVWRKIRTNIGSFPEALCIKTELEREFGGVFVEVNSSEEANKLFNK